MTFRSSRYCKRYEYTSVELQNPIQIPANNQAQKKSGYRFVLDSTSESNPFDLYNSYLSVDFKITKMDNTGYAVGDQVATINGGHSLINQLKVEINGLNVLDTPGMNHAVNIKNLTELSASYTKNFGPSMFNYPDTGLGEAVSQKYTTRQVQHGRNDADNGFEARDFLDGVNANYNDGFAKRKSLLIGGAVNNINLPFISRLVLWVPKMIFNAEGESMFLESFLKPHDWSYLKERVEISPSTNARQGTFRITSSIRKPRHVFIWVLNDTKLNDQTQNMLTFNTFNIANNRNFTNARLELSNGIYYPNEDLRPSTEVVQAHRTLMEYQKDTNSYFTSPTISLELFKSMYGILYFDLRHQEEGLKSESTKLNFHYTLNRNPNANYSLYSLILHEEELGVDVVNGRAILKA